MFNTKKIIIIIVIVVVAFVAYALLISGNKKSSTGVTKQAVNTTTTASSGNTSAALDGPGKEFVTQLLAIQNIKFNLAFFSDPVFRGLQDWSREILPQETGRPNPFAPLEGDSGAISTTGFSGNIGSIEQDGEESAGATSVAQPRTTPRANTSTR